MIVYLMPQRAAGSAYKYVEMLKRELGGVVMPTPGTGMQHAYRGLRGADFAVIRGDRTMHYRACLNAGIPYLLIEHDVATMREEGWHDTEREMIENAAGIIFTSEDCADYCRRYALPEHRVIHLRPLRRDLRFKPQPKLEGKNLVYAGGMTDWSHRSSSFGYRAYRDIFSRFMEAGWTVHAYSHCTPATYREFVRAGVNMHPMVPQEKLYAVLSQYQAGFLGYNRIDCPPEAFAYTQAARPNKTWEYLAAGIPTIAYDAGNTAKLIGRWGIALDSLDNIPEPEELPLISDRVRETETMDEDQPVFASLLREVIPIAGERRTETPYSAAVLAPAPA